jgi:hypothetical protein
MGPKKCAHRPQGAKPHINKVPPSKANGDLWVAPIGGGGGFGGWEL